MRNEINPVFLRLETHFLQLLEDEKAVVRRTTTPLRNPPTRWRVDAAGDVTNTIRTENNREKQLTQYLTRFGNVPTSLG